MTSVGSVEINLKLNTGKLDSQLDKLKNIQIKPDLGRIQPQLTVPVKFADNSYKRQIDELRNHVSKNSEIDIDAKLSEKSIARIKAQLQDIAISINCECKDKGKGKSKGSSKPSDYDGVNIDSKPKPKSPSGGNSNNPNKELIENDKKNTIIITNSVKNNVIAINNSIERVRVIAKEIEKLSKDNKGGILGFIFGGIKKILGGAVTGASEKVGAKIFDKVAESENYKNLETSVNKILDRVVKEVADPIINIPLDSVTENFKELETSINNAVDIISENVANPIVNIPLDDATKTIVNFIDNIIPSNSNIQQSNTNIDESNQPIFELPELKLPEYELVPVEIPVEVKLKRLEISDSENDNQLKSPKNMGDDYQDEILPKSYKKNIKRESTGRIKNNTKSSSDIVSGILQNIDIPALSIPDNDIKTVSEKLREEFTAKGLLQIAKGLGIKPTGKNRNLEPLSKIIAEAASIPDIKAVAKSLGDEVRRATKKTGEGNIKPILDSSSGGNILKYLKDANKQLNDRILAFNEFGRESVESIVADIDVYINSIDEIIKNNKYEPKIGQSLGGLVSQLKYKRESLVGNDASLNASPTPKSLASSKPVVMPIISSLTAKGVGDYQEIIKGLAVKLETGVDKIKVPDIKPSTSLPDGIKAAYEELTNTIYVSQDAIDILNTGIGDSIENLGEETVNETISFLIHELTHAFQASISSLSVDELSSGINTDNIKLPSVGSVLSEEIEKLSELSTNEYIKQLQHLNPGKSLKQLETQYKNLISEVKKREKEAYTAQTVLTGEIVKGFKKQVSEQSSQQQNENINLPTLLASVGSVPNPQQPASNIIQSVGDVVNGFFGEFQSSISNIPIPQIPQVDMSTLTENISQAVQEGVQNAVQTVANNVVTTGVSVAANGAVIMAKAVGNAVAEQANTLAENFQNTFSEEIANIKMPELISNITAPLPHQQGYKPIRQQPGTANPINK